VPPVFELYAERWRMHHPDWETHLWRDDSLPVLTCQDVLDRATGFKLRYDIVRLEILRQFGGVIVDMDVEAIRPFDTLLSGVTAFVGRVGEHHIGNQVLGATPRHPFLERAIEALRANTDTESNASQSAGKTFLRRLLSRHPEGVTVFPARTFYYEPSFDPPRRPQDFPDVFAVHHQLESYAAIPQDETPDRRLEQWSEEIEKALTALNATDERLRARLAKAERRMRRALANEQQRQRAELRGHQAERQQAAIRSDERERELREVVERLQQALDRERPREPTTGGVADCDGESDIVAR
jgi:hypothetical protein